MKRIGKYLLILIAVLALWNTVFMKPLKLFTVYLHELGHAFMAYVFGYGIQGFMVNFNESGYTLVQPRGWFSTFMILNGGYLGSIFFAILILLLNKTQVKKYILGTLALLFLAVSIRFSGFSFTLLYSIIFAGVVLLVYMIQNQTLSDWMIDIIGIASVSYAIYDAFVDTILLQINLQFNVIKGWDKQPLTDAMQLQTLTHIPAIVWGVIWLVISLFAVYAILLKTRKNKRKNT